MRYKLTTEEKIQNSEIKCCNHLLFIFNSTLARFLLRILTFSLQFRDYISKFWDDKTELQDINSELQRKKSEFWDKNVLFFILWWKPASIVLCITLNLSLLLFSMWVFTSSYITSSKTLCKHCYFLQELENYVIVVIFSIPSFSSSLTPQRFTLNLARYGALAALRGKHTQMHVFIVYQTHIWRCMSADRTSALVFLIYNQCPAL